MDYTKQDNLETGIYLLDENFRWLNNWYARQCDGNWEHSFGIMIATLDNPGWRITISLQETELHNKEFTEIWSDRSDNDWSFCKIENGCFEVGCGTFNLKETIKYFRSLAENQATIL